MKKAFDDWDHVQATLYNIQPYAIDNCKVCTTLNYKDFTFMLRRGLHNSSYVIS